MTAYRLGYARVSTTDQSPASQLDALNAAGCREMFVDHASGTTTDRPQLTRLLERLRPGNTLVVWRLDRLGRSTAHLIDTVTGLGERGIGFCSLTEALDTTTPPGRAADVRDHASLAACGYSPGVSVGGSHGPVVKRSRRASRRSLPHLWAVSR